MARNAVKYFEYYTIWTRNLMVRSDLKKSNFLDQLMTSQVPKKDVKYPKIFLKKHQMERDGVKYYKFCMGKLNWTRNLIVRSDFKSYSFLGSLVTSESPKKGCKISKPKLLSNSIKWQKILSNTINIVWISLSGQRF